VDLSAVGNGDFGGTAIIIDYFFSGTR